MDFGSNLKKMRIQHGLTQKQLGELVGVTKSVISFYERQERSPSPDVVVRLSNLFNTSTDELLGVNSDWTVKLDGLDEEEEAYVRSLVYLLKKKNGKEEVKD